jgi:hypothetical protein
LLIWAMNEIFFIAVKLILVLFCPVALENRRLDLARAF